jgi:hypothetical protein
MNTVVDVIINQFRFYIAGPFKFGSEWCTVYDLQNFISYREKNDPFHET